MSAALWRVVSWTRVEESGLLAPVLKDELWNSNQQFDELAARPAPPAAR